MGKEKVEEFSLVPQLIQVEADGQRGSLGAHIQLLLKSPHVLQRVLANMLTTRGDQPKTLTYQQVLSTAAMVFCGK